MVKDNNFGKVLLKKEEICRPIGNVAESLINETGR